MRFTGEHVDYVVIGAGIAGASVAAELAANGSVLLIERENQPGYHTTGRSAALFSQVYGPDQIRALSRASSRFYQNPPPGFTEHQLVHRRPVALMGRSDQADTVHAEFEQVRGRGDVSLITGNQLREMMPLLREGYAACALLENDSADIEVHALHQGYLRQLRERGGQLRTTSEVLGLSNANGCWSIETNQGRSYASTVINTAGAWADEIAGLAGTSRVGLVPKRRTALIVDAPEGHADNQWPMVVDIDEQFYLKPDAGKLLLSPADETPSPPCDAQPEEIDIAICIDRVQQAFDLDVRHIGNRWAGLRSFVADGVPVVGYADDVPGFFWLAGQGGYGIQTAPAMARVAAALIKDDQIPDDIAEEGVEIARLSPLRRTLTSEVT
ncbi:NAD(P)/FAD-dependent oxidoreductase [Aerobium aerolatum]|uniref:Glycine/D-amino acid oxidase n=1 Tax=Aquamicrobium aerolatum DSM 21857 TaxID=1121003 RepID=A0A1I3RDL7_9HYPH|nr:FAD-dependent oxidoreductase [Aquamicrobium aerolatum]SFJ44754.1 Glycine/D-amino acid oxidase [Aquamicrobium aerolatum DSM 21857]